jgi:Asp-tRNA(Asn)/Glu-tRNA(Gln) amidotransferase C subunit
MDFLFHEVSEEEKQKIKEQAKKIIDDFSKKLSKLDKETEEPLIEAKEFERQEGKKKDESFSRKKMFENVSDKNDDFILAEKGGWK